MLIDHSHREKVTYGTPVRLFISIEYRCLFLTARAVYTTRRSDWRSDLRAIPGCWGLLFSLKLYTSKLFLGFCCCNCCLVFLIWTNTDGTMDGLRKQAIRWSFKAISHYPLQGRLHPEWTWTIVITRKQDYIWKIFINGDLGKHPSGGRCLDWLVRG